MLHGYTDIRILRLMNDAMNSEAVSVFSWLVWLLFSSMALVYAVSRVRDFVVVFAAVSGFFGCTLVFLLLLCNRYIKAEGVSLPDVASRLRGTSENTESAKLVVLRRCIASSRHRPVHMCFVGAIVN